MAELNESTSSTTTLRTRVDDFSVSTKTPDTPSYQLDETTYDFPSSSAYFGYYKTIPELKKAIDALAIWTIGKGVKTDVITKVIIENLIGWGEDSFQSIMKNLIIQKKVFGDAFAEIVRNDDGRLLNLKPLYTGDMRVVVNKKGLIIRYEQRPSNQKFKPDEILHLSNDRIANEIHGTSVIEACKWVIDARNEALADERKIKHRELALGVLYVDTDNSTKRDAIITQYENAVKNGEVLVLPKDTAKLEDTKISPRERLAWIQYLENFFYQAVGIPRVIASSQEYSEAASKVGYLTFEPIYTAEQTELESDLWAQLGLKVTFNRPPSLHGIISEDEEKNTGQTGFQQSEMQPTMMRSE